MECLGVDFIICKIIFKIEDIDLWKEGRKWFCIFIVIKCKIFCDLRNLCDVG